MTVNFVYVDLIKWETTTAADLKGISKATGIPYDKLSYRLRKQNTFVSYDLKWCISRIDKSNHIQSNRNPSRYKKE